MSTKKIKTFKGGHNFGNLLGSPESEVIKAELPDKVIIPLKQGFGGEALPVVAIGQNVKTGQIIGINDKTYSSPVHASISGNVTNIHHIRLLGEEVTAVVIKSDGRDEWISSNKSIPDFDSINGKELNDILYLSGLTYSGFPAWHDSFPIHPQEVDNLIIRALYTEPYYLNNKAIIGNRIDDFIVGIRILKKALNEKVRVYIGIDYREKNLINQLDQTLVWLEIYPLKPKYPQEHPSVLANTILGNNYRNTIVLDVQAVMHAFNAIVKGKSIVENIIAVGSYDISKAGFMSIRIGTPLSHILYHNNLSERRCIIGGIITGLECNDPSTPITREVKSISILRENRGREFMSFIRPGINRDSFSGSYLSSLFFNTKKRFDTNEKGEHRPCIYCNYCEEACPVGLMPYLLNNYVTHDMLVEASEMGLMTCIDCGLCTYVCPCKIPLMNNIRSGKNLINEDNQKNS